nr:UDP-glycosyltransferase 73E1-like [Tanacetum cinerariifolium]
MSFKLEGHSKRFELINLTGMSNIPNYLSSVVDFLISLAKMRSARSVIARLVFTISCYFIWQECNNRNFKKKKKRSQDQYIEASLFRGVKVALKVECSPRAVLFFSSPRQLNLGCENFDLLPSAAQSDNLFAAIDMLEEPAKKTLRGLSLAPSCIISDNGISWTTNVAKRIEFTKPQSLGWGKGKTEASIRRFKRRQHSGKGAYGIVVNSFEELEPKYVEAFRKVKDKKVWPNL